MGSKMQSLNDALVDSLKDLHSAETQLLKALPKMEKRATSPRLKELFRSHLTETKEQIARLDQISESLGEKLSGKVCKAMQGLIEEGSEAMEEQSENHALIDALLIGAARRVEHYEIGAYSSTFGMAQELGEDEVASLLEETLDEEESADQKLSRLADREILADANVDSSEDDDESESPAPRKSSAPRSKATGTARVLGLLACAGLFAGMPQLSIADSEYNQDRKSGSIMDQNVNAGRTGNTEHTGTTQHKGTTQRTGNIDSRSTGSYNEGTDEYRNRADADNTKRNDTRAMGDRTAKVTADNQRLGGPELEVLAKIRREIVDNDDLSTNGQNVKIVVQGKQVVLRGPVETSAERTWILETTKRAAPGYEVVNQLEVVAG